jgi:hypothetical protein
MDVSGFNLMKRRRRRKEMKECVAGEVEGYTCAQARPRRRRGCVCVVVERVW